MNSHEQNNNDIDDVKQKAISVLKTGWMNITAAAAAAKQKANESGLTAKL